MKKVISFILILLCLCSVVFAQDKPRTVINSFDGGELSPLLNAREDLSKFHSGLSTMENLIPLPQGAAEKRPGTKYVAGSKENTKIRLLPFEYSTEQAYIIELGNQYARFFANNAKVTGASGSEDISALDNIVAHYLLNDNASSTTVLDDDGNTHDGTSSINSTNLHTIGKVGSGCFNFDGVHTVTISDHSDFDFDAASGSDPFSITAWIYVTATSSEQCIISKYDTASTQRAWKLSLDSDEKLVIEVYDEGLNIGVTTTSNDALSTGWRFVAATMSGVYASSAQIMLYVDGAVVADTHSNPGFNNVDAVTSDIHIGSEDSGGSATNYFQGYIDEVSVFGDLLSANEVASLYSSTYEISTPYLTADLFNIKYEQSADVLYLTHPDYEVGKISRMADDWWAIEHMAIETGPFQDENVDITKTITPSAVTGSITLTATGFTPFVSGTTAGHLPSGSTATSKSQTGALFKLVQSLETGAYEEILSNNYTADTTEDVSWMDCGSIAKGVTWYLTTLGTWTGTLEVQRNYTIGAAHGAAGWETVYTYQSTNDRNTTTNAEETVDEADYRVILTASGDAAEPCQCYFRISDTDHVGIVEITSVTSPTVALGNVVKTLADTTATHRWSEGAWSNYRGWPRTVTFFEDRLVFGGNANQPDTIWASVTGDYENFTEGADDDEALNFTLSSRQVNVIEWIIGKNKLLIGTSGAEWTLAGSADEPLTPSNVKAEHHSTYGSADLQAVLAGESVLFFQRGAEKMRELAYNWETDAYVAPDMTLLVPEITGDGITDMAYQQIPNSILWCVKENGEIAIFVYERNELVTSWARFITDGSFESVAVINGDPEDEVWVSVNRTIGGATKRYIEYFAARDFGSDPCDAYYVDCGITYDSTATTTITGLTHLEAESVGVLADGAIQTNKTVSSGSITISSASTVQAGLPFTIQLQTMPLSFLGAGTSILGRVKRVSGLTAEYYNSGDFDYGVSATNKYTISIDGMDSGITDRKTFPAGYGKRGQVFIYQQSPEPLILISLGLDFEVF